MIEATRLNREQVIVFLGSMNAMPMSYALELRQLGYEVIYFVDAPRTNSLCRPECHFPEITYPYPDWVVEWILPSQILLALAPSLFASLIVRSIRKRSAKTISTFFLNGFFVSLAEYLPSEARCIGLAHGSDLDVWANIGNSDLLCSSFSGRSIFGLLPKLVSYPLIKLVVHRQYFGYVKCGTVIYFPIGFNQAGDRVLESLGRHGVKHVARYDAPFVQLRGRRRDFKPRDDEIIILSVVRFLFRTFPDGNIDYNKGNDVIIEGIRLYSERNRRIRVNFVEKGEDVEVAKSLCRAGGIEDLVTWHKEMPFQKLADMMQQADICFDQVGTHWIGAGVYSMYLGKPLVANAEPAIRAGIWPKDNPVCSASTSVEVFDHLVALENDEYRRSISDRSMLFIEGQMNPMKVIDSIFNVN